MTSVREKADHRDPAARVTRVTRHKQTGRRDDAERDQVLGQRNQRKAISQRQEVNLVTSLVVNQEKVDSHHQETTRMREQMGISSHRRQRRDQNQEEDDSHRNQVVRRNLRPILMILTMVSMN